MKELRKNEFIDMLEMSEILYEVNDKFIKCDIPTFGAVTYYPKADKLQIDRMNKWEENGYLFIKMILSTTKFKEIPIQYRVEKPNSLKEKSDELLRDEFAGMALQGLLSNPQYSSYVAGSNICPVPEIVAKLSYELADAMIKQRKL